MKLNIAEGYSINLDAPPFDTMGLRAFASGMSGAGKSYTLMKFLEEAFETRLQFCLLDVHGEGHVLGELGDSIMVVSDRFGIPVVPEAIPIYLEALQNGMSLVIDLKPMFYDDEDLFFQFLEQFLRKFMSLWSKVATPILLAFDEAQEVMPQSPPKGIRNLYNVFKKIVLGGRKSGVHYLLASQRPALIDKTPISQANIRLFGKIEEQADWDAVKRHVKPFASDDMKELRSGEFILSTEGDATKVKILERRTTDAGATPSFVPKFSTIQKREMGDISARIRELIAKAEEAKKRTEEEKSTLKRLEKLLEESKIREKDLQHQLNTLTLVSEKLRGEPVPIREESTMVSAGIYDEVRSEFDKELKEIRLRHQKMIAVKDKEIMELTEKAADGEDAMERMRKFRSVVADILGTPINESGLHAPIEAPEQMIQKVTDEVLKRIPATIGATYTVAPLEALKLDWQNEAVGKMTKLIDTLEANSIRVLAYLILTDKTMTVTAIAHSLVGNTHGSSRSAISTSLKPLKDAFLVRETKNGYKQDVHGFVEHHIGYTTEDLKPFVDRAIERVRSRKESTGIDFERNAGG